MTQFIRAFSRSCVTPQKSQIKKPFRQLFTSSRCDEKQEEKPVIKNELITMDPLEVASGMYRWEILDRLSRENDPYSVKTMSHGVGTKEEPNIITSAFESRMVGCICEEDSSTIEWMWLHKGESKRCHCGFWFKLKHEPTPTDDVVPPD